MNQVKLVLVVLLIGLLFGCTTPSHKAVKNGMAKNGLSYDLEGHGPVVVLIHGTNLDRRLWADEVAWMKKTATVLTYDMRGQGKSEFPETGFANHDDLIALLDELGVKEVALVGLSAGAQVALDVALQSPERVLKVALLSPSLAGYVPPNLPPFFKDLSAALRRRDYRAANKVLLDSPLMSVPKEVQHRVEDMVFSNTSLWKIDYALVKQAKPTALNCLDKVRQKVLVLVGSNDLAAIQEQARLLGDGLVYGNLQFINGGGHLLNLTSPLAVRAALSEFLELEP